MSDQYRPNADEPARPLQRRMTPKRQVDRHTAARIRTRRTILGLSQTALAESVGMSARQLDAYEHGVVAPSASTLGIIARALDKSAAWFAGPAADDTADSLEQHAELKKAVLREVPRGFLEFWGTRYRELQTQMVHDLAIGAPAPTPAAPAPAAPPVADAPQRARVLVVDDAPDLLVVLGAFIDGAGMDVVRARNGDQALQIIASGERLDAIVSDYAMPGLSGVDLLLQAFQLRPGLRGMIVTGFAESAGLDELPSSVEILRKPFRREELVRRVRDLVAGRPVKATARA